MIIPVPSNNKRFKVIIRIRALLPFDLGIIAYDPLKPNTHYLRRKVSFMQDGKRKYYRKIELSFPISPETLAIDLYDKKTGLDDMFQLEKFEIEKLPPTEVWAKPGMHNFITFAENFSEKAGYLDLGYYHDPEYNFLINYLPEIKGQFGNELTTPARTHHVTGRHQVSKKHFIQFTVPVRFFILLHEREHFEIPTREEKPADLSALQIYLDMGFPTIEAVYAATKVFMMNRGSVNKQHAQRTKDIIDFIDRYKQKKNLKIA